MGTVTQRLAWHPIEQTIARRYDLAVAGTDEFELLGNTTGNVTASQSTLADICGVGQRQVARWRSAGTVSIFTLERIADHLGVHPSELSPEYVDALIARSAG